MAVREVEDWGFEAEERPPPALPPEAIEVEVKPGAAASTKEPSNAFAVVAMLFVFVVELVWLVFLGAWIVRSVL